jgi:hypothetical protein
MRGELGRKANVGHSALQHTAHMVGGIPWSEAAVDLCAIRREIGLSAHLLLTLPIALRRARGTVSVTRDMTHCKGLGNGR